MHKEKETEIQANIHKNTHSGWLVTMIMMMTMTISPITHTNIYTDTDTWKWCKIGGKLVLITNRK